jgi:hypothetical protein
MLPTILIVLLTLLFIGGASAKRSVRLWLDDWAMIAFIRETVSGVELCSRH